METAKLIHVNSLGESSWEEKRKHVDKITSKHVEVISNVLYENARDLQDGLDKMYGARSKVYPYNEITRIALDNVKSEIELYDNIISKLCKPEQLKESDWKVVFIDLVKADDKDLHDFFRGIAKEDSFYDDLRETTAWVGLLSGVPKIQRGAADE